ncbi:amidohydrolase family protein [Nakamurella deserti]|uniref:amidohydrolase family protein n=1 Tax=Nakamurella deserti TaxID=2164074 RepID=UPI000DBE8800|nr:amidohydrolase family protein [Nakamurella deserti]
MPTTLPTPVRTTARHGTVDVHQHLWPPIFVEALRGRTAAPRLVDWTLHLDGEPPYEVDPRHHDVGARTADEISDERLIGLSSPLGVEDLPVPEAEALLSAWHLGATELGRGFRPWASVNHTEPDLRALGGHLAAGAAGLQIAATRLATPAALEAVLPVLAVAEAAGRPVLVHPGPVPAGTTDVPGWWPAVVDYPAQLQAAWWSWHLAGRAALPNLRICFAAGAGLAPVHHERFTARGGGPFRPDRATFVEISSYGQQGVDALLRVLGVDALVFGTDRPYAPLSPPSYLGAAAENALRTTNPRRLLEGSDR